METLIIYVLLSLSHFKPYGKKKPYIVLKLSKIMRNGKIIPWNASSGIYTQLYSILATESLHFQGISLPINHGGHLALQLSLRVKLVLGTDHDETAILLGILKQDYIHARLKQGPMVPWRNLTMVISGVCLLSNRPSLFWRKKNLRSSCPRSLPTCLPQTSIPFRTCKITVRIMCCNNVSNWEQEEQGTSKLGDHKTQTPRLKSMIQ